MKTSIKRNLRRVISLMIAVVMCICCIPFQAFAWKNMTHVTSANLILLELKRSAERSYNGRASVSVRIPYDSDNVFSCEIPEEYQEAIFAYPEAFRAGSMGPDFYPDMLTGQSFIHPYTEKEVAGVDHSGIYVASGEWINLLCDSVNMMPKGSEGRKRALAFTLGFMLHYCGDMFGHDFINSFAGGTYPAYEDVNPEDLADPELNIILSHMAEETYMDGKVNWDFFKNDRSLAYSGSLDLRKDKSNYLDIAAPIQFVTDSMIYEGNTNNGAAKIFEQKYGTIPFIYQYLINLRMRLYNKAEEWRKSDLRSVCALVQYLYRWIEDLDNAVYGLTECFNNMASRMVSDAEEPDTKKIVTEEFEAWLDKYGKYITPAPDIVIDAVTIGKAFSDAGKKILADIGADVLVEELKEWKKGIIDKLIDAAFGAVGLPNVITMFEDRMKDPDVQLDFDYNPFMAENRGNNSREFKEYILRFWSEQAGFTGYNIDDVIAGRDGGALDRALDSDLEAFYNTLVMFKLVLMGPDNFTNFIRQYANVTQTQYQKHENSVIKATSLDVTIHTADIEGAGTDSNLFLVVTDMQGNTIADKLMDEPGHDDFERNQEWSYEVELNQPVAITDINLFIRQEKLPHYEAFNPASEWDCESVSVMPKHAGQDLLASAIKLPGRYGMDNGMTWNLNFNKELKMRTGATEWEATSVKVHVKTLKNPKLTSNNGTNDDVYLDIYDGSSSWSVQLNDSKDNFNNDDDDEFIVSLANNGNAGVYLDNLNFSFTLKGSDEWQPQYAEFTLYHGEIQLTSTIRIDENIPRLNNSTWSNLDFKNKLRSNKIGFTPISLTYSTDVDGGLTNHVLTLDGSRQFKEGTGILWNNTTVRREVFFKIFKGFSPEIRYEGQTKKIKENETFDIEFTLEGVWNGVRASRRDQVDNKPTMPAVNGTAKVTFYEQNNGSLTETTSTTANVTNGKLKLTNFKDTKLKAGTYAVKIEYTADTYNPQYAKSEEIINDVLTVLPPQYYEITFKVENGSWDDESTEDKTVILSGYENDIVKLSAGQIPAVGNKPKDNTYKAGSWDVTPNTETQITGNKTYTYTYAEKDPYSETATFVVVNGSWNNGDTDPVEVQLQGYEGDVLKLAEGQIPAVGDRPEYGYEAGSWDKTPNTTDAVVNNPTYTYTYNERTPYSETVTFQVVNGEWDNGGDQIIEVQLDGFEGDILSLDASQIPAVGNNPNEDSKAGGWDVTPVAGTAITNNPVYTYTYQLKQTRTAKVTFVVVNGEWNDGGTTVREANLFCYEDETLKLSANQIPAAGNKPYQLYKAGGWDTTPDTETEITGDTTYTYTYDERLPISQEVKFEVVNGEWNEGGNNVITVTLEGLEGDILKLSADQIPTAGGKPADTYKAGSWNTVPSTETEITGNPTYTYTYESKDRLIQNVTFRVVNGAWDNGEKGDVTVTLTGYEGDILKLGASQVPAVGNMPDEFFKKGRWDSNPDTENEVTGDPVYTYTYANMVPVNQTVIFQVVNGAWDDGTTEDKVVYLHGYERDVLTIDGSQIPTAGSKPNAGYKAGYWDGLPEAGAEIVNNPIFIYTYITEDSPIPTKPHNPIDQPSIPRPVYPGVTTTAPVTTFPEETDPDTTNPVTTVPDTTNPVITDPVTTDPDTTNPVTTDPDTTNPVTTTPDTTDPDTTDPDTTNPVTTVPDTTDPTTDDPDTTKPVDTPDTPAPDENEPDEVITLTDPVVPAELLEEIKGKNIDVVIDVGNDMEWTINGRTITGDPADIDLTITTDSGIPVDVINKVTGERYSIQIHLDFDGAFPFEAVLTINLKASNAGYFANLFYYNPETKELEYVSASKIDENGNADLNFYHASDYTIIIDREPMDGKSHTDAETVRADSNPHTGTALEGVPALVVFAAAALIFARPRRKKNSEDR